MATMVIEPSITSIEISDDDAWRAVEARDEHFDGHFVFAVRTTGVYCRPSCPSRRALRSNVAFFADPDHAERAGFRPCLRCEPRSEHVEHAGAASVERARAFLDSHTDRTISLGELASHVGLSASHLQRSFKRIVGMSPKEYQDARRMSDFKSRLRAGDTVSRATYEAGFGSSSRVYERADALLGMTPAAFRRGGKGMRIAYTIADSPVGRVLVGTTDRGVCAVELGATDADVERGLHADFPNATIERSDDEHHAWVHAVLSRIVEPTSDATQRVPLDVAGTAFQWQVWKALQSIPAGERRTYSEIASAIGRPTAARAVARACASNRVAVVIPCHRVVREDGDVSGYKWGADRKRQLLERESK
jgi:AraC family transcriptional regulator, regulatory protein of adaptative response / methylated-DNA-[protein]-cysteine methyltransferase